MQEENNFQKVITKITQFGMMTVAILVGLIGILSIFITANLNTTLNFAGEKTNFIFSFGIVQIILSLLFLFILTLLTRKIFRRIPAKYLMIPLSIVSMILFVYWIDAIQLSPEADQKKVVEVATTFVESGDIHHHLQPTQYIHHFPYQCGISYIFSLIFKLLGIKENFSPLYAAITASTICKAPPTPTTASTSGSSFRTSSPKR